MSKSEQQIECRVEGISTIITINRPEGLNAMDYYHYAALEEHVKRAADNPDTIATIIEAKGRYFSAGADVNSAKEMGIDRDDSDGSVDWEMRRALQGSFAGRNVTLTDTFWNHPKVLVIALNGPVVGLSAALVALADFIYAKDSAFILAPFANLSLVTEGAAGYTLPLRLGLSLANEALLASRPIKAKELYNVGFVNKLWPASTDTDKFNAEIRDLVAKNFAHLDHSSVKLIKQLIHVPLDGKLSEINSREVVGGLERFASGLPQKRFAKLARREHSHKL